MRSPFIVDDPARDSGGGNLAWLLRNGFKALNPTSGAQRLERGCQTSVDSALPAPWRKL